MSLVVSAIAGQADPRSSMSSALPKVKPKVADVQKVVDATDDGAKELQALDEPVGDDGSASYLASPPNSRTETWSRHTCCC